MTEPNQPSPSPSAAPPAEPPPQDPRPASEWREPPWFPPRDKDRRERRTNVAAIVFGLILVGVGVYYFLDRTLGIAMPQIQWGSLWPLLLIVLGGLILLRSTERR